MRFPSIKQVAAELAGIKRFFGADIDSEEGLDVRLRVQDDGSWSILFGDASYDQDHRGYWGSSSIDGRSNCREVAKDLIKEAKDDYAQCAPHEEEPAERPVW
jgi:hypothetical protein